MGDDIGDYMYDEFYLMKTIGIMNIKQKETVD